MTLLLMLLCLVFPGGIMGFVAIILLGLVSSDTAPKFPPVPRVVDEGYPKRSGCPKRGDREWHPSINYAPGFAPHERQ
jgi:hypothetical protein